MNWFQKLLVWIGGINVQEVKQVESQIKQQADEVFTDVDALKQNAINVVTAPTEENVVTAKVSAQKTVKDLAEIRSDIETQLATDPNLAGIHKFIETVSNLPRVKDTEAKFLAAADFLKMDGQTLAASGQDFISTLNKLVTDTSNGATDSMAGDIQQLEKDLATAKQKLADQLTTIRSAGSAIRDEFSVILQGIQTHIKS